LARNRCAYLLDEPTHVFAVKDDCTSSTRSKSDVMILCRLKDEVTALCYYSRSATNSPTSPSLNRSSNYLIEIELDQHEHSASQRNRINHKRKTFYVLIFKMKTLFNVIPYILNAFIFATFYTTKLFFVWTNDC